MPLLTWNVKYFVVRSVGTDPVPVGGWQALIGFLVLKGFLSWCYPCELGVALVILVVHKNSGCPEYFMGKCRSDLGDNPWLIVNNILNWVHGPGPVYKGFLIDSPEWFALVIHGLLLYFQNRQLKKGVGFLTLMIFLCIIRLLGNMSRDLKVQWFSLLLQTRSSLLLGHVLPCDIGSGHTLLHLLRVGGGLGWNFSQT